MSYDAELLDPVTKQCLQLDIPHEIRGGIFAEEGTRDLWLNITFNYSQIYRQVFGENGIQLIDGLTGAQSISVLEKAIKQLGDDVDDDYWRATEGNAKMALSQLLVFAQLRPDGIWDIEG
ncbi:MAG: hypothetical protein KME09_07260 [Pleurocapsa minor HA4230-MV1]|jgi:hypothetical protein|nr:hypothetical protein [Pleurocapsa minor HA4230-MV1]